HQPRAIGGQERAGLLAHGVGHREHEPVALDGRHQGQTDAGVAARRLDDRPAAGEDAVALRGLDHRPADAVLHAAARVQVLELRPHLRAHALELWHAVQPRHRSRADQVERRPRGLAGKRHRALRRPRGRNHIYGVRRESIERVAVIFPGALGDFLLALPALRALRARDAKARLTVVVGASLVALARLAGIADEVASLDAASSAWLFGGTPSPAGDRLYAALRAPVLAIHPGAGAPQKRWAVGGFVEVAGWWRGRGGSVLEVAGPAEAASGSLVGAPLARDLALPDLAAVLARATLYVGNDNGARQVADAAV